MTDPEILLSLNSILSNFNTKVVKTGPKVDKIRIITNKRADDQSKISSLLKSKKINFTNEIDKGESSFPVTKIVLPKSNSIIKLIYKKSSGGGSGAGAALTKITESAQALYAAVVFNVLGREMTIKDVTRENFIKASSTINIDSSIDAIMNNLPDDWINSSIAGANTLFRNLKDKKNYTFHRGSKLVNIIESTFSKINKNEKAFGNLNKWSPSDIYIIKNGVSLKELGKENTLKGLNQKMLEYINKGEVIGVSLKKIYGNHGTFTKKNFSTDRKSSKVMFYGTTSKIDSMDGYIQWGSNNSEKIQFRSFGGDASLTGWQGEIKGTAANQGKISLGPINFILKLHGLQQIPTSTKSATLAVQNTLQHATEIASLMASNKMIEPSQVASVASEIQSKSPKYRYSKYLVMKLFQIINNAPPKVKNEVVLDFYLYASSQASYSAPYYKME